MPRLQPILPHVDVHVLPARQHRVIVVKLDVVPPVIYDLSGVSIKETKESIKETHITISLQVIGSFTTRSRRKAVSHGKGLSDATARQRRASSSSLADTFVRKVSGKRRLPKLIYW